ncbi:MAG: DUF4198 domain-containing protein [Acidobacteriota bacterium]|nr:DUF4198 domain-containing protein [Acidobacteriota bacterium]
MRRRTFVALLLFILSMVTANAHDLFLKFDTYFLRPDSSATVRLLNGSFRGSEGVVRRDRMRDVSLVAPGGTTHPAASDWRDEGNTSLLNVRTAGAGTYVVGVSTLPREIELRAADFNEYLAHDGIPDTLAERRRNRQLNRDVRERYSKHVRAIFQVGDARTDDFRTPLGYPVEIIPQQNPYSLRVGQTIEVLCTLDGRPLANQYVLAGRERAGRMSRQISTRTDANGIARFRLHSTGKWFIKMIHMTPLTDAEVNYESKWATLTFEIR